MFFWPRDHQVPRQLSRRDVFLCMGKILFTIFSPHFLWLTRFDAFDDTIYPFSWQSFSKENAQRKIMSKVHKLMLSKISMDSSEFSYASILVWMKIFAAKLQRMLSNWTEIKSTTSTHPPWEFQTLCCWPWCRASECRSETQEWEDVCFAPTSCLGWSGDHLPTTFFQNCTSQTPKVSVLQSTQGKFDLSMTNW